MKNIIASLLLIIACALADLSMADCDKGYASVGAGYKFLETTKVTVNGVDYETEHQSPYSARFELGIECEKVKFGVAHRSQWLTGAPFNDKREYAVTELFVEYKFTWSL